MISNPLLFFMVQFLITLITIFLRGVQTHNIIHGSYKGAAITSFLMSISNVAFIGLIAYDPVGSFIPASLGGVCGVLLSMVFKSGTQKQRGETK